MQWMRATIEWYNPTETWIVEVYGGMLRNQIVASDATPAKYHGKPGDTGALSHVADWVHRKYLNVDIIDAVGFGMTFSRFAQRPPEERVLSIDNEDRRTLDAYIRFQESLPCWHPESTDRYKFFKHADQLPRPTDLDGLHHFTATW